MELAQARQSYETGLETGKKFTGKHRQNADDVTPNPCFGQKAGPTDRHMVVYLPRGSSSKRLLYKYNDIYNSLAENCTMHSCELYFVEMLKQ